jgi:hypothetical protein
MVVTRSTDCRELENRQIAMGLNALSTTRSLVKTGQVVKYITVFCDVTPCNLVDTTQRLQGSLPPPPTLGWRWRQNVPLKRWYLSTELQGVTAQTTEMLIVAAVRISNLWCGSSKGNTQSHKSNSDSQHRQDKCKCPGILCPFQSMGLPVQGLRCSGFLNLHMLLVCRTGNRAFTATAEGPY